MKVLWITNDLFSYMYEELGLKGHQTGGWLRASADALTELHKDVEIAVAAPFECKEMIKGKVRGINFFALPCKCEPFKIKTSLYQIWKDIIDSFQPDIVHIHGTEFVHPYLFIKDFGNNKIVVSIQGLVGVYSRYSQAGILINDYIKNITIKELINHEFLNSVNIMQKRGIIESKILENVKYVIGRTEWDKIHALSKNPNLKYYFNNETLRESFYNKEWSLDKCRKHTIFLSQVGKPIKGFHMVLKALPLILKQYPDTKIYISGNDYLNRNSLFDEIKRSTFARYINNLISENGLKNHIIFLGMLNEKEMANAYQNCHVFVCPSSIENSPNSLGEAQIIGTPLVASYVGGIPDMVKDYETGLLYRFEEYEILAYKIMEIFDNDELALRLSENEKKVAHVRHDRVINADVLYNIYNQIILS